jgi:flagellar biogenesis protein FliO
MHMRSKYAWLLLPPILALIVFLGPLQNLNGDTSSPSSSSPAGNKTHNSALASAPAGALAGTRPASARRASVGAGVPQLPNFWQISSTLVGVLLLGVVFLGLMRKLKENSRVTQGSPLVLRQSLRLSAKHHVHAVQYEDKILVLGTCENNVSVLCTGEDPSVAEDEARLAEREREEGAVPRDMILPRPDKKTRQLPKKPTVPTDVAQEAARKLANFRNLLQRARAKAEV